MANILTLAAYEQAQRALRGDSELQASSTRSDSEQSFDYFYLLSSAF